MGDDDINHANYPWVKQLNDTEQDTFLKQFFSEQLWKCKDDKTLSSIPVHRGYHGSEHNLDAVDLNEDDRDVDKQNDFERDWQKKNSLEFEKEINTQINKQNNNKSLINHQNHKNETIQSKREKKPKDIE